MKIRQIKCSLRRLILFATISLITQFVLGQTASVKGNISDQLSKDGLANAYISINKTSFRTEADDKGNFEIKNIPAGEYDISFENVGYSTAERHIHLKAGEAKTLFVSLSEKTRTLDQVTVFGKVDKEKEAGSRDREKYASNIENVISSEAIVRSPDINAANVLQRMSGITVQRSNGADEAYAVVRGMEPRYNNTLLNGIKIASPDSKNRFVQLDIIPSDILSSIEISKSLLPDMEGDATGGTINMIVKDAPVKTAFKATGSIGYSQLFLNDDFINFKKSDIQKLSPIQRNPPGYVARPEDFTRSNLDFQPKSFVPNGTLGFSYSQRLFHDKVGVVIADNTQNQYSGYNSRRYSVAPISITSDTLGYLNVTSVKGYSQQFNNGLVAHVDYDFNERNKVNIDNFLVYSQLAESRISNDTTLLGTGRVGPGTGQIFYTSESFTQHQHIENLKLSGTHVLRPDLTLEWAGVLSEAGRHIPDLADIETDNRIQADHTTTNTYLDQLTRKWLKNDDKDYTEILNLSYRKVWKQNKILLLKTGGLYRSKTRFNNEDDYTLKPLATNSNGTNASKPVWTNIYDAQWEVFNTSGTNVYNPNNYKANEIVSAGYLMAKYSFYKLDLGGGVRIENTTTGWNINVHSSTAPSSGNQKYIDVLPSIFFKYKLSKKENLHFSYFKSISRPNYYELVPAVVFGGDYFINGNPYLQHSVADNFDVRYELFPKGEQHFFIGVFYKKIQNPIENLLQLVNAGKLVLSPQNSQPATNFGGEFSFTQYFGRFGLTGNYTYTHSSISSVKQKIGGGTVVDVRPLQGQTNHIVNVSVLYKDVRHGAFAQLSYEYQGKTLAQTSLYYQSDYYQRPMNTLAFSIEKDIHKHWTIFGKFNNLLNTPSVEFVQGTLEVARDTYKASYSVGIRYDL